MSRKPIVSVTIGKMVESEPKGASWWVIAHNSVGQRYDLSHFYNRDHALTDRADWADFLGIDIEPYVEDGVTYEPTMPFERFSDDQPALIDRILDKC